MPMNDEQRRAKRREYARKRYQEQKGSTQESARNDKIELADKVSRIVRIIEE